MRIVSRMQKKGELFISFQKYVVLKKFSCSYPDAPAIPFYHHARGSLGRNLFALPTSSPPRLFANFKKESRQEERMKFFPLPPPPPAVETKFFLLPHPSVIPKQRCKSWQDGEERWGKGLKNFFLLSAGIRRGRGREKISTTPVALR